MNILSSSIRAANRFENVKGDIRKTWNLTKSVMYTNVNKLCGRLPQYAPAPCKLTFDLLTLKVVSESRVTWATSVPILVLLGLSVLYLAPMYATDKTGRRQTRIIA